MTSWRAILYFPLALGLLFPPLPALADNWRAHLYDEGAPSHMVGVDKKRRLFNFFEKKSPLRLRYSYPCTTGQSAGDKERVNDLRTPEGVYFVEYKIASGLDFREYGGIAYTLNYPNPVDRLRGKTGHGIWIHSKGFDLVPTRGCVAIPLRDIAEVGPFLTPGTPVILAEELGGVKLKDSGELASLRNLMSDWSEAWGERSPRMFDFYDPEAYSRGTESFDAFRRNKERLFKLLTFIKIYNREIHAVEGPGYWVTWSEQFYTASNLSTEGIRRLYWQKGADGRFRIVGMEWIPRDVGMRADFLQGKLVAQGPLGTATDASSEAPVAPRLDMPEQDEPAPEARKASKAGPRASIIAMAANLAAISEPLTPGLPPRPAVPDEIEWGVGRGLLEPAPAQPSEPAARTAPNQKPAEREPALQPQPAPAQTKRPAAPEATQQAGMALDEATLASLKNLVADWEKDYRGRDPSIARLYDDRALRGKRPAKARTGAQSIRELKKDFAQAWLMLLSRDPRFEMDGGMARASMDQMRVGPRGAVQGRLTLWLAPDRNGQMKIAASDFRPMELGMEANYLEAVSDSISSMLENWRRAWQDGKLDAYISHYTPDALQQGRLGAANIRRQKDRIWARAKPVKVDLTGLRLAIDPRGIRADMNQVYFDSQGHGDRGVKTLLLKFDGRDWRIQREDWSAEAPRAQAARP